MKKQALKDLKEPQAKEYILELVSEYCRQYHTQSEYRAGDRIPYTERRPQSEWGFRHCQIHL